MMDNEFNASSKIVVNHYWLGDLWAPLSTGSRELMRLLGNKDVSEPGYFDLMVKHFMKPSWEMRENRWPSIFRKLKATMQFGINFWSDEILQREIEDMLVVCIIPPPYRTFYIRLWEALFPGEDPFTIDRDAYEENNDRYLTM